jgi:hypothetical protein
VNVKYIRKRKKDVREQRKKSLESEKKTPEGRCGGC